MKKTTGRRRRLAIAGVALAVGAVLIPALPASAATGTINCGGNSATILNGNTGGGNSIARTYNYDASCGSVAHGAYVNQNGQVLWVGASSWSSATGIISRTFYGAMQSSRHYHNGTYNNLY